MFEYGILAGALIVLAFYLRRCSFRVEEGHVAVLTTFGRAEHEPGDPKKLRIYRAGLSFKWPWQKAVTVSTKEQNLDLSGEEGAPRWPTTAPSCASTRSSATCRWSAISTASCSA